MSEEKRSEQRTVNVLPVSELGSVIVQEDGTVVILFEYEDGEMGVLLQPEKADELTGALIERPRSKHKPAFGSPEDPEEQVVDVVEHAVEQEGPDAYVFRIESDSGTSLTFRLGGRRLVRIRNMMTAQIVRHLTRKRQ